jgi:ATP phosphoribosyltransferase regulatory subunit
MIFEGYTPGLGHPVCGGGRYDNLIEKFNGVKPATGFMINIDGVLKVLERIQCKNEASKDILIVYNENSVGEGVEKALDYRNRGYTTDIISEKQMGKLSDEIKNIYKKIIRV